MIFIAMLVTAEGLLVFAQCYCFSRLLRHENNFFGIIFSFDHKPDDLSFMLLIRMRLKHYFVEELCNAEN